MSETVSATMAVNQVGPTTFQYSISLTDTSESTPVGTFWFAWDDVPDTNFLISSPISGTIASPTGWNAVITHNSPADGYGIQWVAASPAAALQPGQTFTTFSFETPDPPSQIFRLNTVEPDAGFDITSSFVYAAGPESDPGFNFTVPCFASGTRLLTQRGEIAVEELVVGERLPTVTRRGLAPIRWLGHRTIDCRRHPRPHEVWPVRISAGAFAAGRPARDIRLSPDHAVHVEGALIPVRYLVNGATIAREPVALVEYWHVELPAHAVLLADGLTVESYLDTGNRSAFANGGPALLAHPDFSRDIWARDACAPLLLAGPVLAAVRESLLHRAQALGHRRTADPALHLVADDAVLFPETDGNDYRFGLPDGVRQVRLRSRAAVPAELSADGTDCRRLGVAVARLALDGVIVPLDSAACAAGWHAAEARDGTAPAFRWTDGDATLLCPAARRLEVTIAAMPHDYWADNIAARRDRGRR